MKKNREFGKREAGKIAALLAIGAGAAGCSSMPSAEQEAARVFFNDQTPKIEQTVVEAKDPLYCTAGPNALQFAQTDNGDIRTRLYTNIGVNVDALDGQIIWRGMNEVDNFGKDETGNRSFDNYFGRNTIGFKPYDCPVEFVADAKFSNNGFIWGNGAEGIMYGARVPIKTLTGLVTDANLVDCGSLQVTADLDDFNDCDRFNTKAYLGWNLTDNLSLGVFNSIDWSTDGNTLLEAFKNENMNAHTELDLSYNLGNGVSVFGRLEAKNFRFDADNSNAMVGVQFDVGRYLTSAFGGNE